ncbi:molybdate transport system regulatory protein [Novosphingobium sp. Rr 2-17]|uniref:winged helix-turn-helix domain-containing protein n=1 Tax=Novosphingobium sp. Rr 2-17 TaxID=555793 RepID=UPI000269A4F3|nr:LysR family transcriptional regulator [Novosphingobium sp. Rr 2-17]EIZ79659.1 molybdate transport system regulatory protein [Novosphingobium sp. Rr 2-17]
MTSETDRLKIKVQLHCGDEIAMGPGKADLLEAIDREGSISAAGRAMGMSYRRTWLLVDAMNRCWDLPLVETTMGGKQRGGARVTDLGRSILRHYRTLQNDIDRARAGEPLAAMLSALRDLPRASQQSE